MKKLYVTVSDETYELLENYLSSACSEVIGASKSSVVNSILYSALSNTSVFKDDINFVPLDCLRSVDVKPGITPRCTFSLSDSEEKK